MGSANGVFVLNGFWTGNTQLTAIDNHPSEQVEWDRNGQRLAAGASDGTIHIWSLAAESPTDRIDLTHPGAILALRFSADGRRLGSVAEYQGRTQARVWTFETAELVRIGCGTVSRVSLPKNDCREAAKFVDCDICRNVPEK
jgi:WD40 repeat protein